MATKKPATNKPTTKKPATKKVKPVGNVSKKTRHFAVYIMMSGVAARKVGVIVEVPPGEDADRVCEQAREALIANEVDGGWREATVDDVEQYG